jgi:hypothetical protein
MAATINLDIRTRISSFPSTCEWKYGIKEGMRVLVKHSGDGILVMPITPIEDLAEVDAGKLTLQEMRKALEDMRSRDRY